MADILLKYIQDLPAAGALGNDDLLLIHQQGNEKSLTLNAFGARFLSRQQPFADIKSDGPMAVAEALLNLGISSLTSLDTANSKWLWKLPNGVIYQIFKPDAQNSTTSGAPMDNTMTYPVAFPSECFAVLICKTTYVQIIVSAEIATRTQCKVITLPVVTPTVQWSTTTILAIGR